jgi:hypothetical protein
VHNSHLWAPQAGCGCVRRRPAFLPTPSEKSAPARPGAPAKGLSFGLVPVHRPHHADPGQHGRPATLGDQKQRFHSRLPFRRIMLALRQFRDEGGCIAQGHQLAAIRQRNRIVKGPLPTAQFSRTNLGLNPFGGCGGASSPSRSLRSRTSAMLDRCRATWKIDPLTTRGIAPLATRSEWGFYAATQFRCSAVQGSAEGGHAGAGRGFGDTPAQRAGVG